MDVSPLLDFIQTALAQGNHAFFAARERALISDGSGGDQ